MLAPALLGPCPWPAPERTRNTRCENSIVTNMVRPPFCFYEPARCMIRLLNGYSHAGSHNRQRVTRHPAQRPSRIAAMTPHYEARNQYRNLSSILPLVYPAPLAHAAGSGQLTFALMAAGARPSCQCSRGPVVPRPARRHHASSQRPARRSPEWHPAARRPARPRLALAS